ncbi:hypothetical protein BH10PSE1_BH10PSE1_09110 [soil metagenome]
MLRYQSYLEDPTLDGMRMSHAPVPGLGLVFICPFVVCTSESGRMFQLMRGVNGRQKGVTINFGIYEVTDELDVQGPFLYKADKAPVLEPLKVTDDGVTVGYGGDSFNLEFGVDAYRWTDAKGGVELSIEPVGKVSTFWIPAQDRLEHPQMLRSHMGRVTGMIDGEAVTGLFMADFIYSRPDLLWNEMGMMSELHNVWLNWMVEYEDGGYEGGLAWRGRPGTEFAAAHHVIDGVSTGRCDARIELDTTERGTPTKVRLSLGQDTHVELTQRGSQDWPMHTCGAVTKINRDRRIKKSWNYTEFYPLNWPAVLDYFSAYEGLHGKPPSWRKTFEGARIVDQKVVWG